MSDDYGIMEEEISNLKNNLKRHYHMMEVRKLVRKHEGLAEIIVQKKQIKILRKQIADLQPTISRLYSSAHVVKDHQIKGYLIYLLEMKDYFTREVKAKKEMIRKREDQIKRLLVRLCTIRNEYAKKLKTLPAKSNELMRLENAANRKNQIDRRVSTIQAENKILRDNISDLQRFQKQYKEFEKKYRERAENMEDDIQTRLDNAVSIYEEKDAFHNRTRLNEERCSQDLQKLKNHKYNLNLVLEKTKNFNQFEKLQNAERIDTRLTLTGNLMETSHTGLEPVVKEKQNLFLDIARAAGQDALTASSMNVNFNILGDTSKAMFACLEGLLENINHTENVVEELKAENKNLLKSLSLSERKLRWEIGENEAKVGLLKIETEQAEILRNSAREDLDNLYANLWRIYGLCGFDDSELGKVDDDNAEEVKESIEKEIIEYLMLMEYIKLKELSAEEHEAITVSEEFLVIEEKSELEFLDTIKPRKYGSQTHQIILSDVDDAQRVIPLEGIKGTAQAVVSEIETEDIKDIDENA